MATTHLSPSLVLVLSVWPALSSCLSIEEVPRVSAPGSDSACFDRGPYEIGEYKFQGMSATCDGTVACLDGACNPLPPCSPSDRDNLSECSFTPLETWGQVGAFSMAGEYIYWTELGTFDERKNYQKDGAVARARVGEWLREELHTGLDLYDEALEEARTTKLTIRGEHLFLSASDSESMGKFYRGGTEPGTTIDNEDEVTELGCVVGDEQYWVDGTSLFTRSLQGRSTRRVLTSELPGSDLQCAAVIGEDVFVAGRGSIIRVTQGDPVKVVGLMPSATLLGAYQGKLVARIGTRWVSSGKLPEPPETLVAWGNNVAGGVEGTSYLLEGDYLYWYRNSPGRNRKYEVILRGRLDGVGTQEVVAEVWDQVASDDDIPELFVGTLGVGWCSSEQPTGLHFYPLPKVAP